MVNGTFARRLARFCEHYSTKLALTINGLVMVNGIFARRFARFCGPYSTKLALTINRLVMVNATFFIPKALINSKKVLFVKTVLHS